MWREAGKPVGHHINAPVLVAEDAHSSCGHSHCIATHIQLRVIVAYCSCSSVAVRKACAVCDDGKELRSAGLSGRALLLRRLRLLITLLSNSCVTK